jgi:hypothetical protein
MDALICAEWLLTGPSDQRLTDGAVLVEAGRISAVGLRSVLQARTGGQIPSKCRMPRAPGRTTA